MPNTIPQQFTFNRKFQPSKPDFKDKEDTPNLHSIKIYVTEDDYFLANFPNIFTDYTIIFENKNDVFNWMHSPERYMKFWQCQLNFAVWCATSACGISMYHLFDAQLPNLVKSVMQFHVYFTIRKLLSCMSCPLPGDSNFCPKNNIINISKFRRLCDKYNAKNVDFRFNYGLSHGMGVMYTNFLTDKNKAEKYQYGDYNLVFRDKNYKNEMQVDHLTNPLAKNGWKYFIPKNSLGLSQPGIQSLNDAIRYYVILILGAQVETHSQIIGETAKRLDAQAEFLTRFENAVNQWKDTMLSNDINQFQYYISQAKVHLNYVIGKDLYIISNRLVINENIQGYDNNLIVATANQYFGENYELNSKKLGLAPKMQGVPSKTQLPKAMPLVHPVARPAARPVVTRAPLNSPSDKKHRNVRVSLFLISAVSLSLIWYFKDTS